jgi:hypothetical protein
MNRKLILLSACAALTVAGCASYDGHTLKPGASEADVTRTMGKPDETVARANGDKVLFYSRQPAGRQIYGATIAPDGSLRGIAQTLVPENISRISAGISQSAVRDLLGPPYRTGQTLLKPLDTWEYRWQIGEDRRVLWVAFASDGVAKEVTEMHDFEWEPNSGQGKD